MDNILDSIKDSVGIEPSTTAFDMQLMMHINSALMNLHDIGAGPEETYGLVDGSETWDQFFDGENLGRIKSYVYLYVLKIFDPPQTHVVMDSMGKELEELLWRIRTEIEQGGGEAS